MMFNSESAVPAGTAPPPVVGAPSRIREVTQSILHGDPSGVPGDCMRAADQTMRLATRCGELETALEQAQQRGRWRGRAARRQDTDIKPGRRL